MRIPHFNDISISTSPVSNIGRSPDLKRFEHVPTPLIMGIINVTPDSFSDGGRFFDRKIAIERGVQMVDEGADILDIGGESTRPFSDPVLLEEELRRVLPVVEGLSSLVEVPLSIDTRHAEVARKCLGAGASMVNDVGGLRGPGMEDVVVETGASAVIMHMKGEPKGMQVSPIYDDVVAEVHDHLRSRVERLVSLGVPMDRLFIDPGIGFGKRVIDNLILVRDLRRFLDIGCPVVVGVSRKSFIGKVLGLDVGDRLEGSLSAGLMAVENGASVLRVHDVRETKRAVALWKAIKDPVDI